MAKYFFEFKQLIRIGIPIFGSQLSYTLMGATDTIIAGRASANDLAGLAVGTAFSNTIWFFFTGIIFAVTPIVAQLYGAKKVFRNWSKTQRNSMGCCRTWTFYGIHIFQHGYNYKFTTHKKLNYINNYRLFKSCLNRLVFCNYFYLFKML